MRIIELDQNAVQALIPQRKSESHKGDYGRILLLCGSRGYTGAAALAAMGALRSGAGLVYLGVPESIYVIEAVKLTEAIVIPLPEEDGMFSALAAEQIKALLPQMDAVLIGPGLGKSTGTDLVLKTVLECFQGPVVVDADGINQLVRHKNIVRGRTSATVLTPHFGEYTRLGGIIDADRIQGTVQTARDWNCILLLKGHRTIITDGYTVYRNVTGNPGMAVGGSGDMLAGMIVSLIGQGVSPLEAAACSAWLHGAAGDICAEKIGQNGMLPTDMLHVLPRLMK